MVKKIIHYNPVKAGKLHCDNCHYNQTESQPFRKELIGTLCPVCNANMLTESDYNKTIRFFRVIDIINKLFGWLGTEHITNDGVRVLFKIHNDDITITTQKDLK